MSTPARGQDGPLYIYGTGGFAREVAVVLYDNGEFDALAGFVDLDDAVAARQHAELMGKPVFGERAFRDLSGVRLVVGVGDPATRRRIVESLPADTAYATVVHRDVRLNPWIELGPGSVVCAGCILTVDVALGAHTHLNLDTTIGHGVRAGDYFTTAPSVNVSGECTFGDGVYLGTGAGTRQGLDVAAGSVVGMGAMLVKPAKESGTYVGIPAKRLER